MKIEYQEVSLKQVVQFYADQFKPRPGEQIFRAEWFVDAPNDTVVFKLLVDDKAKERGPG